MISEPNTMRISSSLPENVSKLDGKNHQSGITSILSGTDLCTWQQQACVAFFNAKVRYNLMLANGSNNLENKDISMAQEYYKRRRQDLITLGIPKEVIGKLDKLPISQ